jgi:hypothetical protein
MTPPIKIIKAAFTPNNPPIITQSLTQLPPLVELYPDKHIKQTN